MIHYSSSAIYKLNSVRTNALWIGNNIAFQSSTARESYPWIFLSGSIDEQNDSYCKGQSHQQCVFKATRADLMLFHQIMNIPVVVTEQNPQGQSIQPNRMIAYADAQP